MRQNLTMIFDENVFLRKFISDTILFRVPMACTEIRMQSLPNDKYRSSKHSVDSLFGNSMFEFPEHKAFCLCKVSMRCHR